MKQKYQQDYRIYTTVDDNGKIKDHAEYIGPRLRFLQAPIPRHRGQRLALAGVCLEVLLILLPLLQRNHLSSVFYGVLPHILTLVPLWFALQGMLPAPRLKEPLTREQADAIANGGITCPPIALGFTAAASIGSCLWLFLFSHGAAVTTDWIFLGCDLLAVVINLLLLKARPSFATAVEPASDAKSPSKSL